MALSRNIYFFYPSRVIGGAELLFIRIANYLSKFYINKEIGYIGFSDDIALSLLNKKVRFVIANNRIKISDNTVIVTHPARCIQIPEIIGNNIYYTFWILHLREIDSFLFNCKVNANNACCEFSKMVRSKSVICMDDENRNIVIDFVGCNLEYSCIVPVMLDDSEYLERKQLIEKGVLNVAWIGRLSEDKINSLINLIENFEKITLDNIKIKLHIIGEGPCEIKLFREYKNFSILMHGSMQSRELTSFLQENVDLVFAMGTSMLEAEKLGIPSVLLFYSEKTSKDNCFLWSFKLQHYCLGIENRKDYEGNIDTLEDIIKYFVINIQLCSIRARKHFERFIINRQINKFIACINNAEYSNEMLKLFYNENRLSALQKTTFKNKMYLKIYNYLKRKLLNKGLLVRD